MNEADRNIVHAPILNATLTEQYDDDADDYGATYRFSTLPRGDSYKEIVCANCLQGTDTYIRVGVARRTPLLCAVCKGVADFCAMGPISISGIEHDGRSCTIDPPVTFALTLSQSQYTITFREVHGSELDARQPGWYFDADSNWYLGEDFDYTESIDAIVRYLSKEISSVPDILREMVDDGGDDEENQEKYRDSLGMVEARLTWHNTLIAV